MLNMETSATIDSESDVSDTNSDSDLDSDSGQTHSVNDVSNLKCKDSADTAQHLAVKLSKYVDSLIDFHEDNQNCTATGSDAALSVHGISNLSTKSTSSCNDSQANQKKYLRDTSQKLRQHADLGNHPRSKLAHNLKRNGITGNTKHLKQLELQLGLNNRTRHAEFADETDCKEKTANGQQKHGSTSDDGIEVVTFRAYRKNKQNSNDGEHPEQSEIDSKNRVIDIKQARHDVLKFGIKGLKKEKKELAREQLAIKLGAKPPKKNYTNYKEFIETKKKQKQEELDKRKTDRALGFKIKKPEKTRKRDRNDVGRVEYQIGKYKHGVQSLNSRDLWKIKTTKLKKM